jgi:hypothetical protein
MKAPTLLEKYVWRGNQRGIAVVYIALMLVVLFMFVGLAIDIGYMYVAKTQLQNAADAAALAGASQFSELTSSNTIQLDARNEAINFALKNYATKIPVTVLSSSTTSSANNEFSESNDITVGNWDGTTYHRGLIPINAIEVRARRTDDSSDSPIRQVSLFFGRVFGWDKMSASAVAIAGRGNRAALPITMCIKICGPTDGATVNFDPPKLFYWSPYPSELNPDGSQGIAWTSFSDTSQSSNKPLINSTFCGNKVDVCGKAIYSTNSTDNSLARQFRCAFKNPDYDSLNKTCSDNINSICGPAAGRNVSSWTATVPIFDEAGCPPGAQPLPYNVVKYAKVRIIEVYADGGGGNSDCACQAYDAPNIPGSNPNAIIIDQVSCVACNDTSRLGNVPKLLR